MTAGYQRISFPLISLVSDLQKQQLESDIHELSQGVETEARDSFSSTEAAWQNAFEICSYISTVIFSRPDQFKWPALLSVIAVGTAGFLYAMFVRIERGHLVHLPKCFPKDRLWRLRERGLERILSSSDL